MQRSVRANDLIFARKSLQKNQDFLMDCFVDLSKHGPFIHLFRWVAAISNVAHFFANYRDIDYLSMQAVSVWVIGSYGLTGANLFISFIGRVMCLSASIT